MTEICLFPIPNCVTFPGTVFPLHVFEPRYRKMIHYCLDNEVLLGICHTQKTIQSAKQNQSLEQALQSNQATYLPYEIFSAGKCELIDTTDDGRMYLNIHMQERYKTVHEKQTLPFLIYQCEAFPDQVEDETQIQQAYALKAQLLTELQQLLKNNSALLDSFSQTDWEHKTVSEFSYEIFGFLIFRPEQQQQLLSIDSVHDRLQLALDFLRKHR